MYNNEIQCNTSSSWPKRDTVTLFDQIEIHFTNPSRITFQTLNKKLIAIPNSAIYDPPTESNQFNPIPFTRLTGHDLSTPAESTPPLAVQWPRNIRRLLSRARYIQIAFRLTGTEIAFIFSYRKIAAGLKVYELVTRNVFPCPTTFLSSSSSSSFVEPFFRERMKVAQSHLPWRALANCTLHLWALSPRSASTKRNFLRT